ncbi:uncharacterized protein TRAVEDRAFT_76781, partial [Trametes versicolor FP-101664 SS1]|uniref:uncharacterized protein n=1 Tax=Trametes versicolor (strain FP-101664) TaxID=717944 RepID=UPI0004623332
MSANAVMFAQPIGKAYSKLPPPREDMDECLAILFIGPCKPTEKDLKRTPFVIRRRVLVRALEWLILNHPDYEHVAICEQNLESYEDACPPVTVVYRHEPHKSEDDSGPVIDEEGVDNEHREKECTFTVHGLSEEDYVLMGRNEKIAAAIRHFNDGGGALGFGHAEKPTSLFNDPALYPRMFPWLFPYGLGGVSNDKVRKVLGRKQHIRSLLLRYD